MNHPRSGILAFLLVLGCASPGYDETADRPQLEVHVSPERAEFRFPIPAGGEWIWNREGISRGELEYAWEAIVNGEEGGFAIGVYRFAQGRGSPRVGSLRDLLSGTQSTLWVRNAGGGASADAEADVWSGLVERHLTVVLNGGEAVSRVFGTRPESVRMRIVIQGEEDVVESIPIRYVGTGTSAEIR